MFFPPAGPDPADERLPTRPTSFETIACYVPMKNRTSMPMPSAVSGFPRRWYDRHDTGGPPWAARLYIGNRRHPLRITVTGYGPYTRPSATPPQAIPAQPYCRLVFCDVTPMLPGISRSFRPLVPWSARIRALLHDNAWSCRISDPFRGRYATYPLPLHDYATPSMTMHDHAWRTRAKGIRGQKIRPPVETASFRRFHGVGPHAFTAGVTRG